MYQGFHLKSYNFSKQGFTGYPNNPWVRQVPCGSYSGYGTARDLAKLMGILANGGSHKGRSYMSPETTRLLTEVLTERVDDIVAVQFPYGRGTTPFKSPLVSSFQYNFLLQEGKPQRGPIISKLSKKLHEI